METSLSRNCIKSWRSTVQLPSAAHWLRLLPILAALSTLTACAVTRSAEDKPWPSPTIEDKEIVRNRFKIAAGDDVIGQLAMLRLENGDTLPDIARHFGLGINALTAANPGVEVWVPKAGGKIILPLSFILPEAQRRGIVVNLAAMRLFRFKGAGKSLEVSTYPIGIGMKERPSHRADACRA